MMLARIMVMGSLAVSSAAAQPVEIPTPVQGPVLVSLRDGSALADARQIAGIDRGAINDATGSFTLGGQAVTLAAFSGIAGYSSDVAYLLVARGSARIGGVTARAGDVLLLGAFGAPPMVRRFDARRYSASLPDAASAWAPMVVSSLDKVARAQATALFFGLYRRTAVKVQTRGDPERNQLLATPAVREVRFSGGATSDQVEYEVITTLARALVDGDPVLLGQIIDPLPFGGAAVDGPAATAREAYARQILAAAPWAEQLKTVVPVRMTKPGVWVLQGADSATIVTLRPTRDFIFVQSVQPGEAP